MCHHLVALAQLGHAGAGRCDRPGRLRPERHRSRAADLPAADPDKLVPVADAGGDDVGDEARAALAPRQRSATRAGDIESVTRAARVGFPITGAYPGRRGDATGRMADDPAVRVDVPSRTVTFLFTRLQLRARLLEHLAG